MCFGKDSLKFVYVLIVNVVWMCFTKMAENKIRRQALTIQENEELAEAVRKYPCLYDKSKKEYKDNI